MKIDTMKILTESDEIHAFVRDLLRNDLIKDSYDTHGIVWEIVDQFARQPRFFFWPSHEDEQPHFSAWWGGIQMREYANPAIHDLYYLHEMWHAGTMSYMPGMTFDNFTDKMVRNELEASVASEMAIYFEIPELRKETFPYEIFVDRFLFPEGPQGKPDANVLAWWAKDKKQAFNRLKLERKDIMHAQIPDKHDDVAFWTQKFSHQNEIWSHLWFSRYDLVETTMDQLQKNCEILGKAAAMQKFMTWLTSDAITLVADAAFPYSGTVPFPYEARAFAATYALTKGSYNIQFERNQGSKPVTFAPTLVEPGVG